MAEVVVCAACKHPNRRSSKFCGNCGKSLRRKANQEELVQFAAFGKVWEAELARTRLESHGIKAWVPSDLGPTLGLAFSSQALGIGLMGRKSDVVAAKAILKKRR